MRRKHVALLCNVPNYLKYFLLFQKHSNSCICLPQECDRQCAGCWWFYPCCSQPSSSQRVPPSAPSLPVATTSRRTLKYWRLWRPVYSHCLGSSGGRVLLKLLCLKPCWNCTESRPGTKWTHRHCHYLADTPTLLTRFAAFVMSVSLATFISTTWYHNAAVTTFRRICPS